MSVNIREKIENLDPIQRKKVEDRAAALIAEEMGLRDLRKARKLTQARVAKTLGITQDGVSRLAFGIKGKGDSPFTIGCTESQFLHVGVARAFEGVNTGSAQLWPKFLEHERQMRGSLSAHLHAVRQIPAQIRRPFQRPIAQT